MQASDLNRHMQSIFNTMSDGLIVIAPEGSIVMVNKAFEALTGYRADEVIGQPCTLLSCDACELAIKSGEGKIWWCALFDPKHEGMKRCRCNYLRKDGRYVPVLKNASVLRDEAGIPLGAVETLTDISELDRLDRTVQDLSRQLDAVDGFCGIIGASAPMLKVFDLVKKAAASDAPVLIYGESGTGKELVARAVHQCGLRSEGPYIQFSCAALNQSLLESELFGHAKGAFTGAYRHRIGRFEAANGGDIFLDEIGDVPPATQVKLLRVLESKQLERVGEHQPIKIDARIISATNQDLEAMIQQGSFRQDLFFRINVIPINLPPLSAPLLPEQAVGLSERDALVEALRRSGGNQTQAAKLLGVNRVTVYNRMRKYGIELKLVLDA
jgi:two-component system response regulator HydG